MAVRWNKMHAGMVGWGNLSGHLRQASLHPSTAAEEVWVHYSFQLTKFLANLTKLGMQNLLKNLESSKKDVMVSKDW